ncbi:hypothetical protein [Shewanella colwelliana]|uniref:hypothetical protein n=1 Tax=Shewanella colwelliana TaxID=23 RepID=UPI000491EBDE|nr:hypothetical protein [Shewanella colwelliana]
MVIRVRNGKVLLSNGSEVNLDSSDSDRFFKKLNSFSKEIDFKSDYINEMFIYFYLKLLEFEFKIVSVRTSEINFKGELSSWVCILSAINCRVKIGRVRFYFYTLSIVNFFVSLVVIFFLCFLMPWLVCFKRKKNVTEKRMGFSIIRSPASISKLEFLLDSNVVFYSDDFFGPNYGFSSMYSEVSMIERVFSIFYVPLLVFLDCFKLLLDTIKIFGWSSLGYIFRYYSVKIVHKNIYKYHLDCIMRKECNKFYYTSHKEDRFAVVDIDLCGRNNVRSICIPHGVEYGFYVPTGLPGDTFYCTSQKAADDLNLLYNESKFIFDSDIALKMFSQKTKPKSMRLPKKIIFFTEALGVDINMKIIDTLLKSGLPFSLKLHPKDVRENYQHYGSDITFVTDFGDAISGNICLARKSTVLIEAIYNESIAIAVLFDARDQFYVENFLPSLSDPQIHSIRNESELIQLLQDNF